MKMAHQRKEALTETNYKEVLRLTSSSNIKSFKDKCGSNLLAYISSYHFKSYNSLVRDIEIKLNIQEVEESEEEEYDSC